MAPTEIGAGYVPVEYDDTNVVSGVARTSKMLSSKLRAAASDARTEMTRIEAAASRAATAADKTSSRVAAAAKAEADALGKLRVAQTRLDEVRSKAGASAARMAAAEEALAKANRDAAAAQKETARAVAANATAQGRSRAAADAVARATREAGQAAETTERKFHGLRRSGTMAFGQISASTKGLTAKIGGITTSLKGLFAVAATGVAGSFLLGIAKDAEESATVMKKTVAIVKATGGAAKVSAAQVAELAGALSAKTGIDDEAIQTGSNLLLTFKKIRNEVGKGNDIFTQATGAALDLSKAGFGSIDSASVLLGKALNDPVKGLAALGRAGVTFTQGQKATIKSLVQGGRELEAQKLILAEVKAQVGGVATASAKSSERIATAWGNAREKFGEKLQPAFRWLADFMSFTLPAAIDKASGALGALGGWVQQNESWLKPLAVGLAAAAAVLGVCAAAAWVATAATTAFGAVLAFVTSPIGVAVIAIGAITAALVYLYQNNDTVRAAIQTAWAAIQVAFTFALGVIRTVASAIGAALSGMWNMVVKPVFNALKGFVTGVLAPVFQWFWRAIIRPVWDAIKGAIEFAWNKGIKPVFSGIGTALKTLADGFTTAKDTIGTVWGQIKKIVATPIKWVVDFVVNPFIRGINSTIGALNPDARLTEINTSGWDAYATGGRIRGWSPTSRADNIPIWATAGEYMQPVSTVRYYGQSVMEAMRRRLIPRELFGLADGGPVGLAKGGMVYQRMAAWLRSRVPWARVTSAYRAGSITSSGNVSYHASGRALDLVASGKHTMMELFRYIKANVPSIAELIYSPAKGAQVHNGRNYLYRGRVVADHFDHVHWAMRMFPAAGQALANAIGAMVSPFKQLVSTAAGALKKTPGAANPLGRGLTSTTSHWLKGMQAGLDRKYGHLFTGDPDAGVSPGLGDNIRGGSIRSLAARMAASVGWGGRQFQALAWIIQRESGWNPLARNPSSGAYGLPQALPGSKMASAGRDWRTNPATQLRWMLGYVRDRYGDPVRAQAFWKAHNWYGEGGPIQELAAGGRVGGRSPHRRADNIPIWGTAGEWMHPVRAASYYGDVGMRAISDMRVPRTVVQSYAYGGPVGGAAVRNMHRPVTPGAYAATPELAAARAAGGVTIIGDVYGDPERFARSLTTRFRDEMALVNLSGIT